MMASLADHLGISGEHELVIGASFQGNSQSAFHTIKYDFKPASVDASKAGSLEVGDGGAVTVALSHVEGSGQTKYRGNSRPYQKECVLVIDHDTGLMTLERLVDNVQLKKTRSETMSTASRLGIPSPRPMTPIDGSTSARASPQNRPPPSSVNRGRHRRPQPPVAASLAAPGPGSMPLLGMDNMEGGSDDDIDDPGLMPPSSDSITTASRQSTLSTHLNSQNTFQSIADVMSDSSSDSDSDPDSPPPMPTSVSDSTADHGGKLLPDKVDSKSSSGVCGSSMPSMPAAHLLTDLQLSDSE